MTHGIKNPPGKKDSFILRRCWTRVDRVDKLRSVILSQSALF